jgi:hypothetical protein
MMTFPIFITALAFSASCFAQTPRASNIGYALKDTVDKAVNLGWQDDTLPTLEFKDLSSKDFLRFKRQFKNRLEKDLSKIVSMDTAFIIYTSKAKLIYNTKYNKHFGQRGFRWAEYIGYLNSLDLFVLEFWSSGEFTIGELFLIDSISNTQYNIISPCDSPATIVLSPSNGLIASYANAATSDDSYLQIIKVSKTKGVVTYKEYAKAELDGLLIVDLVWINHHSLALKVNRPIYSHITERTDDNYSYVQAEFTEDNK